MTRQPTARRRSGQTGSVMIMIAVSIVALFGFAILAIDGAIMMTTKTQLQNAADAAALAGASALLDGGGTTEARQRAIAFAGFNYAEQETLSPVVISEDDVTFPEARHIRVQTHRTAATGDPLRTYFRRVVDLTLLNQVDVTASATAWWFDVCGSRCLKPWSIPDRWNDLNGNGAWDPGEPYDPAATGYVAPADVGLRVVLKIGDPSGTVTPSSYYPVCYPPLGGPEAPQTGGDAYRECIAECEPFVVSIGDSLLLQPGRLTGPTQQGVGSLLSADPGAHWDGGTQSVQGSAFGLSPRVVVVPLFDPRLAPVVGAREVVHVTKLAGFFIEDIAGDGTVSGRFMEVITPGVPCEGVNPGALAHGIGLTS